MKNILFVLFAVYLFTACSDGNDEPSQDYTSLTLTWIGGNSEIFSDYKTAYFNEEGKCILLFEHEQFQEGIESKEYILPKFVSPIYLFYTDSKNYLRLEEPFAIKQNKKNKITIPDSKNPKGIFIAEPTIYNWPH